MPPQGYLKLNFEDSPLVIFFIYFHREVYNRTLKDILECFIGFLIMIL
jgi:hypothetical protein